MTRAVVEALVIGAVTLLILWLVATYVQNILGVLLSCFVAGIAFLVIAIRAKRLMEDYG